MANTDTLGCVFNLDVWSQTFALSGTLSTADAFSPLDVSYNAIVNIELADFGSAFTFTKTHDVDGTEITHFNIDKSIITQHMFAPFAHGTVMDVAGLGSGYGGVVAQNSVNFGSTIPSITGPTHPILSDTSMTSALNSAVAVETRSYADASNNRIASDYIGFLGYQCFGNSSACNLFSDTSVEAYAAELPGNDTTFIGSVETMLIASSTDADQYTSGELKSSGSQSLCYLLYHEIMALAPGRFDPTSADYCLVQTDEPTDTWALPVQPGDVMECILTMQPASNQSLFGQSSSDTANAVAIEDRKYLIRFVIDQVLPDDENKINSSGKVHSPRVNVL